MRNLYLFTLLLAGCSSFHGTHQFQREIASTKKLTSSAIDLALTDQKIFANGANHVFLKVSLKDEKGNPLPVNAEDLKIISDVPLTSGKFAFSQGVFVTRITPQAKSPSIRLYVQWKDRVSSIIELETTLAPAKDKLDPGKSGPSMMTTVSGLTYTQEENLKEGLYDGFSVENRGKNDIVKADESYRSYEFSFEQHARQNIGLLLSDAPNSTISHTMHSHFVFFPRKILPIAQISKNEDVTVTLPNGEKIIFDKDGRIVDGIFKEGPIDYSPDRFKRTYPDLKYTGKGILLRANARGQMPQQGQFESTKIDMEYGIKYSADVLIINGTTGQRCRRPKLDFWTNEDVSPIPFKFPTDKEFDTYLKAKCGFGIPDLSMEQSDPNANINELIEETWKRCEATQDVDSCVKDEFALIEDPIARKKVAFELNLRSLKLKSDEAGLIASVINSEIGPIRETLLKDSSWISDFDNEQKFNQDCLAKSQALVKGKLRFHDLQSLIKDSLILNCSSIKAEMIKLATPEVDPIRVKIESDFSWATVSSKEKIIQDCLKQAGSFITSEYRYSTIPSVYATGLKSICESVEKSQGFQSWILTQSAGLEEKVYNQLMVVIEADAEARAQYCLNQYPMDTQINRIRYKKVREACLVDHWEVIEQMSIDKAKKDPLVMRVNLSFDNLRVRIAAERRRLQLKIIKKYFF